MSLRLVAVFTPFEDLTDPRIERSRRHELFDVVVVALCATLAGSDTWADIERFGKARIEWLRTFLRLKNGIPSHDTFGRVFSRLDPAGLLARTQQWLDDIGLVRPASASRTPALVQTNNSRTGEPPSVIGTGRLSEV
jgi:hypothetical protein